MKIIIPVLALSLVGCVNSAPKQSPTISAPFPRAPKASNTEGKRLLDLHLARSTKAQEAYLNCSKSNATRLALTTGDPMALAVEAELNCTKQRNALSQTLIEAIGASNATALLSETREDATRFNYVWINKIRNAASPDQARPLKTPSAPKTRTYAI